MRFEPEILCTMPMRNIIDHPDIVVKFHEKVTPILLKRLFCSVPFLGLTHLYRALGAGKILVRSNRESNGLKKDKKFSWN